jgi:hypothetical protein
MSITLAELSWDDFFTSTISHEAPETESASETDQTGPADRR